MVKISEKKSMLENFRANVLKRHGCARVVTVIDAMNSATKHTNEMKAKFSYCDQRKFKKPIL